MHKNKQNTKLINTCDINKLNGINISPRVPNNEWNDSIEDNSRLNKSSPEQIAMYYESLGNWNNMLPKTDYTYSPSSKFYNQEISPGIPLLPNMSRSNCNNYVTAKTNCYQSQSFDTYYSEFRKPYRSNYGTDVTPEDVLDSRIRRKTIAVTTKSFYSYILKIVSFFMFCFKWVYNEPISKSFTVLKEVLTIRRYFYSTISTIFSSSSNIYSVVSNFISRIISNIQPHIFTSKSNLSKSHCQIILFFALLPLLLSAVGFYILTNKTDISSVTNIPYNENSATLSILANILNFFKDVFLSGISIPYELLRNVVFGLFEIVNTALFSTASSMFYIINVTYTFGTSLFPIFIEDKNHVPLQINIGNSEFKHNINYTKLAEVLLEMEKFKQIIANSHSRDSVTEVAEHVQNVVRKIMLEKESVRKDINENMKSHYVTKEYLINVIHILTQNVTDAVNEPMRESIKEFLNKTEEELFIRLTKQLNVTGSLQFPNLTFFEEYVNQSIHRALNLYDADKTGLVDYALESAGGEILNTRCTETLLSSASFSLFGLPLWRFQRNPRIVIQPGVHPGECWAFSGSMGFLVIRLSQPIFVTGFSLEHIPRSLAPNGNVSSAPKQFSVWGLDYETDTMNQTFLGRFCYDIEKDSLQYFKAEEVGTPFNIVELKIESNHGKIEYTCIYRFRVHGIPV